MCFWLFGEFSEKENVTGNARMATKETKNFGFSSVGLLEGLQQQESVIHGAFFSRTSGSVSEINLFGVEFVSRG